MHSITVWLQLSSNQTENFSLFHALGAEYDTNCKIAVNYSYKSEAALDSWLDRTFNITLLDNLHEPLHLSCRCFWNFRKQQQKNKNSNDLLFILAALMPSHLSFCPPNHSVPHSPSPGKTFPDISRGTGIKQLQSRLGCCRRPALAHAVVSFETTQRYVPTVWGCDRWKWFRTIFVFFLKLLPPAAKCLLGNEHGYD